MEIHELNTFSGTPSSSDFLAIDNGTDTGKISGTNLLAPVNTRIDNIISGVTEDSEVVDGRLGADGVTYGSLGTAIRTQVSDLKADLNITAELLNNLPVTKSVVMTTGGMIRVSDGVLVAPVAYTTWAYSDYIPIPSIATNFATNATSASGVYGLAFYGANKDFLEGALLDGNYQTALDGTYKYVRLTNYNANSVHNVSVTFEKSPQIIIKNNGVSTTGFVNPNVSMECGYEAQPRKNLFLGFYGTIPTGSAFYTVEVGLRSGSNYYNKLVIDGTNATFTVAPNNDVVKPHGLTIAKNIQVEIRTTLDYKAKVRITSNGEISDLEFTPYQQWRSGKAYAKATGTLLNCKLSWENSDIAKRIWYLGDSYTALASNRWANYASAWLDNILLDGYGGEPSTPAITAFNGYLDCGTPQYAVLATGMNDGDDTDASTPSSVWITAVTSFLASCKEKNITPILCTIPTTPEVNNNGKNAYVKSSGYRYIDFALAVGADSDGNWYSGMLGDDEIHPTVKGAKALCAQIAIDLPEVFIP